MSLRSGKGRRDEETKDETDGLVFFRFASQIHRERLPRLDAEVVRRSDGASGLELCDENPRRTTLPSHPTSESCRRYFFPQFLLPAADLSSSAWFRSQVVHCDLKAANILTTKSGNVKLSDFGVSLNLVAVEHKKENDVAGTPNWSESEPGPTFPLVNTRLTCSFRFQWLPR